jgi:hypothetical protein
MCVEVDRKGSSHDGEKNEVFVEVNRKGSSHDGEKNEVFVF